MNEEREDGYLQALIGQETLWYLVLFFAMISLFTFAIIAGQHREMKEMQDIVSFGKQLHRSEIQKQNSNPDGHREKEERLTKAEQEAGSLRAELNESEGRRAEAEKEAQNLMAELKEAQKRLDSPPLVILRETEGFYFASGSAEINEAFQKQLLGQVVPQIVHLAELHHTDQIEIVGHTDGVPVRSRSSNLDRDLLAFLGGSDASVQASDNVGLGILRASAVARILSGDSRLEQLKCIVYSAGCAVSPDGSLSSPDIYNQPAQERRRIEIRLKRSRS